MLLSLVFDPDVGGLVGIWGFFRGLTMVTNIS